MTLFQERQKFADSVFYVEKLLFMLERLNVIEGFGFNYIIAKAYAKKYYIRGL